MRAEHANASTQKILAMVESLIRFRPAFLTPGDLKADLTLEAVQTRWERDRKAALGWLRAADLGAEKVRRLYLEHLRLTVKTGTARTAKVARLARMLRDL